MKKTYLLIPTYKILICSNQLNCTYIELKLFKHLPSKITNEQHLKILKKVLKTYLVNKALGEY